MERLYEKVCKFSSYLKTIDLKKGDRVAAYVPNKIESIISFLACAKNGIIWSSCSPDLELKEWLIDLNKLNQVFNYSDHYFYNGKKINILEKINDILKEIPSIKKTLVFAYNKKEKIEYKNFIDFDEGFRSDLNQIIHLNVLILIIQFIFFIQAEQQVNLNV